MLPSARAARKTCAAGVRGGTPYGRIGVRFSRHVSVSPSGPL